MNALLAEFTEFGGQPAGWDYSDGRAAVRFPLRSTVRIWRCEEAGAAVHLDGQGLNLSETGAALVVAEPLPVGARVHLELPHSRLSAGATVRNCMRRGLGWRVGVELGGPLMGVC